MLRTLARLTDIGALTTSRTEYSSAPARGSMDSTVTVTMAGRVGVIRGMDLVALESGIMAAEKCTVTPVSAVAVQVVASMAEARCAAVVAASTVVVAQVMEADTGKRGVFA